MSSTGINKELYCDYAIFYNNITCLSDINVSGLSVFNNLVSGSSNLNALSTYSNLNIENLKLTSTTIFNNLNSFSNSAQLSINNLNATSTTIFNNLNSLSTNAILLINNKTNFNSLVVTGNSTFITNLNINGNLGLGMNPNQKLSINGIGEFVNANSTKIILSTDVSNNSRHSISSNHDAGVGNNNYIDLNVWDNSLTATTLGT